jgi:D-alanyl-D-alanine endopeptidase (penicillin-binding protein 7)
MPGRWLTIGGLAVALAAAAPPARADDAALPEVQSAAVLVLDARTGTELYGKAADDVRAIASTTKIFVAMAVRKHGLALDDYTEIVRDDVKAARGGARTRLDVGQRFKNVDLLRAMLIASDNRAPTALARGVGMTTAELIAAMNEVAEDLGLKKTRFTDPSGLRGNVSTAREMALATRAALEDDVLREIMLTQVAEVRSESGYAKLSYGNTNLSLFEHPDYRVAGKTGYTTAAGYCFIAGASVGGRDVVLALLGAEGKTTRFTDFDRIAAWLDRGAPGAKVAYKAAPGVVRRARPQVGVKASGTIKKPAAQ